MSISSYLEKVGKHYHSGHATEHTYRGDFAELVKTLVPNIHITNEPSNVTDCGNPDYVITRKKIPIGFIEAKDLGKDLNSKQYKEQFGLRDEDITVGTSDNGSKMYVAPVAEGKDFSIIVSAVSSSEDVDSINQIFIVFA